MNPKIKTSFKKQLMISAVLFIVSFPSFSQNYPLPDDHPILTAAPNLPAILKFNGNMNGLRYTVYLNEQEETSIKHWALTYPEEVKDYKEAIASYLKQANPAELPEEERVLYYDLQAQLPKIDEYCATCN